MLFEVNEFLGLSLFVWMWLAIVIITLVVEFMTAEIVSIWFFFGSSSYNYGTSMQRKFGLFAKKQKKSKINLAMSK